MPLYLVRWPNLSACIVRARNNDDLDEILDELADPYDCERQVYNGPLWIEFELPVKMELTRDDDKPLQRDQIGLQGIDDFLKNSGGLKMVMPGTDTGGEMERAVFQRCFPLAWKALDTALDGVADAGADPEELDEEQLRPLVANVREALLRELDGYIAGSWKSRARMRRQK
jgi:hypothetical protein